MMIRAILIVAAIAATTLALSNGGAHADSLNIYQATLAEANQTTQEVSTEQLRRILADGSAIVLDTRTRAEFDAGHIPGARNLDAPAGAQVAAVERMVNGDKSKALVLYCNGPYCQASRRLADQLVTTGHTNVQRYQLGIPIWRALGGPTEIKLDGIARIFKADRTAVFIDGRPVGEFASGSLPGAHSAPADEVAAGRLTKLPLPEDDFNRHIVRCGRAVARARRLAGVLSKRPWHNVAYLRGSSETLPAAVKDR